MSIKADFFHAAYQSARKEADDTIPSPKKWISWREYRVLLAIYSLKWNNKNYCEAGWETIRCRASGFYNKTNYREFEESAKPWADHILPLSRDQITRTIQTLEELNFFMRVRISSNKRHGGKYAYSIRHKSREALMRDVESKQAYSRGDIIRENRARDHLLQLQAKVTREKRIKSDYEKAEVLKHDLEKLQASNKQQSELPAEADKHSKPASHLQGGPHGCQQHNEKSLDEKSRGKKSNKEKVSNDNIPSEVVLWDQDRVELGYLIEGRFVNRENAIRLFIQMPHLHDRFEKAKRYNFPNGITRIEKLVA